MSSSSWQRLLYPGLLLFGLSLPLSKSASTILLGALWLSAVAGALCSKEFRDDVIRSSRQPLTAALALYCIVAYAGIVHTEKYADGFSIANKYVSLPVIYFFVSVFLQSDRSAESRTRKAEMLLFSFLAGLTALNLIGVLTYLGAVGGAKYVLPLAPLGLHHIWFSNINALGIYMAVAFLLFTRQGRSAGGRTFLGGYLGLSVLCILLSMSRTAWFGIAVTVVLLAVVLIKSKKTIVLFLLLSVLTCAFVYRFVPLVRDRINLVAHEITLYSTDRYQTETSIGDRLLLWRATLLMIKGHPVIGVGTGDFEYTMKVMRKQLRTRVVPSFLLRFNQPHNIYLFAMATNGIGGLAALLYIFYRSLRFVTPVMRSDGTGKFFAALALATTVHFMVAGLMDSFFNIQVLRYSFAFVMGVCIRSAVTCAQQPRPRDFQRPPGVE